MKKIIFAIVLSAITACGAASSRTSTGSINNNSATLVDLAGKAYCRMASSGGILGQPAGYREHCITFTNNQNVTDNGSTFFGNPPEHGTYTINGKVISLTLNAVTRSYQTIYTLSDDSKSISAEGGIVLNLKN